jgi:hypothetical protein
MKNDLGTVYLGARLSRNVDVAGEFNGVGKGKIN